MTDQPRNENVIHERVVRRVETIYEPTQGAAAERTAGAPNPAPRQPLLSGEGAKILAVVAAVVIAILLLRDVRVGGVNIPGSNVRSSPGAIQVAPDYAIRYTGRSCRRSDNSTGAQGYSPDGQIACYRY